MAVLSDADRVLVWADYMRDRSAARDTFGALTKAQLLAAVYTIDSWLNDNATALNQAIPQTARTQLTTAQKARLIVLIVEKRYISGV